MRRHKDPVTADVALAVLERDAGCVAPLGGMLVVGKSDAQRKREFERKYRMVHRAEVES